MLLHEATFEDAEQEQAARKKLAETFPPGTYRFAAALDHDGQGNGPYWLRMALTIADDGKSTLDFSDSDDQAPGPINYLVNPAVPRAMMSMYLLGGDPPLLLNSGSGKAIDEIVTRLRMLIQELRISLIMVSHLRRPQGQGHEDGAATSLSQLRGSAAIAQLSDMVIGLERNGQAENEVMRNTTTVRVLKNRFSGITGPATYLYYDKTTGRLTEVGEPGQDDTPVFDNSPLADFTA